MKSPEISLLLLTHNSLENLNKYFAWVKDSKAINQVVIVDDDSSDGTDKQYKSIFSTSNVTFIKNPLNNDFSSQRTLGLSKCKNDWILWLDSDETPSKDFIEFLDNFDDQQYNFSFKRLDTFLGKKLLHGENHNNNFVRLFNKNYGQFIGKIHELWKSSKPTRLTNIHIFHYPHPDLKTFFEKINFYSTIRADELFIKGVKADMFDVVLYPIGKFLQNYIFKLGFLDSTPGIIMAIGMSFHSFLVRSKLWHLCKQP